MATLEFQNKLICQLRAKIVLKPKPKHPLSNLLKVYFDFAYYFFVSPFRLQFDENIGYSISRKHISHLLTFALLNGLAVLKNISRLREYIIQIYSSTSEEQISPAEYFYEAYNLCSTCIQLLILKQFIFRPQKFIDILNFIQNNGDSLSKESSWVLNQKIIGSMCLVHSVLAFCDGVRYQILDLSWDKIAWDRNLVIQARNNFFLSSNFTEGQLPDKLTAIDYVLAFSGALANVHSNTLDYYPDITLFFAVLTVQIVVNEFAQKLASDRKPQSTEKKLKWLEVHRNYQNIRQLCELVNKAFGSLVTAYLTASLLFQATGMDHMLATKKISSKIIFLIYIIFPACTLLLSADVCSKLDMLRVWLTKKENRQDIPFDELQVVLDELKGHHVGIRGSNIFTITYSLLWNALTTVVTYFIICLQTRQQQQQCNHCNQ